MQLKDELEHKCRYVTGSLLTHKKAAAYKDEMDMFLSNTPVGVLKCGRQRTESIASYVEMSCL